MTLGELYQLYKAWKTVKGSLKEVKGSGAYKILELSSQVDQLTDEYAKWKILKSDDVLAIIKKRLKTVKDKLSELSTEQPKLPGISKDMNLQYARNVLDTVSTSEMARNELMRVYWEQDQGALPEDDYLVNWPSTRARLASGRDTFQQAAREFRVKAYHMNSQIDEADRMESQLRDVRNDPHITSDQLDMLEQDYKDWVGVEMDAKDQKSRLEAMAKAGDQAAANLSRLIEAGDLVHGQLHAKD